LSRNRRLKTREALLEALATDDEAWAEIMQYQDPDGCYRMVKHYVERSR